MRHRPIGQVFAGRRRRPGGNGDAQAIYSPPYRGPAALYDRWRDELLLSDADIMRGKVER